MFILSSDIFSHLLLSSIYLTSTSVPFSLSGHPSSSWFQKKVVTRHPPLCFAFHKRKQKHTEEKHHQFNTDLFGPPLNFVTSSQEKDISYKTSEAQRLDSELADLGSDKESQQTEMSALMATGHMGGGIVFAVYYGLLV